MNKNEYFVNKSKRKDIFCIYIYVGPNYLNNYTIYKSCSKYEKFLSMRRF